MREIFTPKHVFRSKYLYFLTPADEPPPTLALSYQSCSIRSGEIEKILHFWELGSGKKLESVLDTIITPETRKGFSIFICFDITKNISILDVYDWLPMIMRRFREGCCCVYLVGTHYDGFEETDPSGKAKIIRGLRSLAYQFGAGLILSSHKNDQLTSRFKSLLKSIVFTDMKRPEMVDSHILPVLIHPQEDPDMTSPEAGNLLMATLKDNVAHEEIASTTQTMDKSNFPEEQIDKVLVTHEKALEDSIRALRASITE